VQSGGLLVAATLKYADAVLKTLATSGSIGKPMMPMGVIMVFMRLYDLYVCFLYHVCECVCLYILFIYAFRSFPCLHLDVSFLFLLPATPSYMLPTSLTLKYFSNFFTLYHFYYFAYAIYCLYSSIILPFFLIILSILFSVFDLKFSLFFPIYFLPFLPLLFIVHTALSYFIFFLMSILFFLLSILFILLSI
jgi:hypothetical protein